MSVHHWGENPDGTWILEIHNDAYSKWASDAKFFRWSLNFHGVEFDPNDPAVIYQGGTFAKAGHFED